MRIVFLTHYFPPEGNAPAARTWDHCVRWARAGHDVLVITCVPNVPTGLPYEGYMNRFRQQHETVEGVEVIRVWTILAANVGFFRRSLNYLSFMFSAVWVGLRIKRPDVLVATSPQFFCGWAGAILHRLRGVPFVLEIRDLWPESIAVVGAMNRGMVFRLLEWMERKLYETSSRIVAVTTGIRDGICARAEVAKRVSVVSSGVDVELFSHGCYEEGDASLRIASQRFMVGYVGTIGLAHGLEVVVDALCILKEQGRNDIGFLMVGDGACRVALQELSVARGVSNLITFVQRVGRQEVPRIVSEVDALLIHLIPSELFRGVVPTKLFEAMAMNRPVLLGVPGEARQIMEHAEAGLSFEPGSGISLAHAVLRLADDAELYRQVSAGRARTVVCDRFERDRLSSEMLNVLIDAAAVPPVEQGMHE